jgi:general secretion pathway protein N
MRNLWLLAIFAVALLISLAATAPLSLALGGRGGGLTAKSVEGTIWSGRLRGAALGPLSLGEVKAGLDPLGLFTARLRYGMTATGGAAAGRGQVTITHRALTVRGLDASAPLQAFGATAPFGGMLRTRGFGVAFEDGRCKEAIGQVTADLEGLGDAPVTLTGRPACQGKALAIPLSGQRDGATVSAVLVLQPDGRYRTETTVATTEAGFGIALEAAGFDKDAAGYSRTVEGQFR